MIREFSLLIQEFIAMKLLELAMWVAPPEMELSIAKAILLTFPVPPAEESKDE